MRVPSILGFLLSLIIFTSPLSAEVPKFGSFEQPPVFEATELLEKDLVKSPLYTVSPKVKNDGYLNHYELSSRFGKFHARGRPSLERRIYEIHALDVLEKKYPSSEVAGTAVANAAEGIVTAPIRGVEKAYDTLSDPDKLEKTAKSVPGGIASLFGAAANAVADGATFVYETGSSVVSGDSNKTSGQMDKAGETISDVAGDLTGYSKARRELCRALKIDPYTDNKVLLREIRRVSGIQSGVAVASKFAPGIGGVPYVGTVNTFSKRAEQVAAYDDPKKAKELNEKIAKSLDLSSSDPSSPYARFLANNHYTPAFRGIVMNNLKRLKGVKDMEMFLEIASRARARETAALYVSASESLANYHEKEEKLTVLVSQVVVPAGISKSGELVVPLPVDHLVWTKDVATVFENFESRVKQYPVKRSEIRIAGTASPRTVKEFKRLGAEEIKQNVGYL